MENLRVANRLRDELEADTDDNDSDWNQSSDDDSEESDNVTNDTESDYDSENESDESLEQSVVEDVAVLPARLLLSKDKNIQYSKETFDTNRRHSFRRSEVQAGT